MSKAGHSAKHVGYFFKGTGYVGATTVCAATTFVLATATCGLAMTGIGIPLALLTAGGTAGAGAGTFLSGKRVGKNYGKAFSHCHKKIDRSTREENIEHIENAHISDDSRDTELEKEPVSESSSCSMG